MLMGAMLMHWYKLNSKKKNMVSPEMAKPEKPTARTRNEMATTFVWEKPTTSSRVASIPNPDVDEQNRIATKNELNVFNGKH